MDLNSQPSNQKCKAWTTAQNDPLCLTDNKNSYTLGNIRLCVSLSIQPVDYPRKWPQAAWGNHVQSAHLPDCRGWYSSSSDMISQSSTNPARQNLLRTRFPENACQTKGTASAKAWISKCSHAKLAEIQEITKAMQFTWGGKKNALKALGKIKLPLKLHGVLLSEMNCQKCMPSSSGWNDQNSHLNFEERKFYLVFTSGYWRGWPKNYYLSKSLLGKHYLLKC